MLNEGKDVSQDLAGVKFVGQPIDHRNPGDRCKTFDLGLFKRANHHDVSHATDDLGAVFDRLGATQLAVSCRKVNHAAAELVHACFKTHAGAGRGLLKNHG